MAITRRTSTPMQGTSRYLYWSEVSRLIRVQKTPRNRILVWWLASSGRRVGELVQVRVKDIDFRRKRIVYQIEKKTKESEKTATLPLGPAELVEEIKTYIRTMKLQPTDFVFKARRKDSLSGHLCTMQVWRIISKTSLDAGIETTGNLKPFPHALRHSFAMHTLEDTGKVAYVKKMLQHSSLDMTAGYLDADIDALQKATKDTYKLEEPTLPEQ